MLGICAICKEERDIHQTITHVGGGEVVDTDHFCQLCWEEGERKDVAIRQEEYRKLALTGIGLPSKVWPV